MDWFSSAGLGLFIHWGLYAIPARGEWHLWKNKVPLDDYNALAHRFAPPASFSPEDWVLLAKRMGARYAVLTTRHHDGFCLWDTDTTDFNSAKTAAKRDFVREYVEACRRHGLRVGLYYSIGNWQFSKRPECLPGTALWEEMVQCTHAALRELMTRYGKIDLLWYDGCSAPGVDDAEALDRLWRAKALNAMARELQPGILINDRSGQPEDFSTPEQCLAAPPRGRRWESCMTVNGNWGYTADDHAWKSPDTLIRSALHCARFGGNLLLNIGPRADGSVPAESVAALEALGDYLAAAPQAFYGSTRDDWTEATHEAGVVVKTAEGYFLHDFSAIGSQRGPAAASDSPAPSKKLDGAARLEAVAPGVWKVAFREDARPCNWLGGRHDVEIKAGAAPVLGVTSDRYSPPGGELVTIDAPGGIGSLAAPLPSGGRWRIEIGFTNAEGFKDTFSAETEFSQSAKDCKIRIGDLRFQISDSRFETPDSRFEISDSRFEISDSKFEISDSRFEIAKSQMLANGYAYRLSPVWRVVPPETFEVAGKFASPWYRDVLDPTSMIETMAQDMPALAARTRFVPLGARNALCDSADVRVNFAYGAPDTDTLGFGLARTMLRADREKTIMACIGQDWWSDVYLNGERLAPISCAGGQADRPAFQGHKPVPFLLPLRAGDNELLVANHGGNRANWFALWTNG